MSIEFLTSSSVFCRIPILIFKASVLSRRDLFKGGLLRWKGCEIHVLKPFERLPGMTRILCKTTHVSRDH